MTNEEIDKAIAEEIMGWTKHESIVDQALTMYRWLNPDGTHGAWGGFSPTRNWEHTGMVIEKMEELGFGYNLQRYDLADYPVATFDCDEFADYPWFVCERDKSPRVAVSKAALEAFRKYKEIINAA